MSSDSSTSKVDISQIKVTDLPTAEFPGGKNQPFRIFFRSEAHAAAWAHATGTTEVEICGVLVGKWAKDDVGPYVDVEQIIQGEAAASKLAEVTFTHETWSKINSKMDSEYSDLSIVGWYHSHPDFGIFLSDRDLFIQESFFSNPGQIALVIDPVRKTEGVFIWKEGKTELTPNFWVGNELKVSTAAGEEANRTMAAGGTATGSTNTAAPGAPPEGPSDSLYNWLTSILLGICLFMLGALLTYWVSDFTDNGEVAKYKQEKETAEVNANALAMIKWGVRPGLRENLDKTEVRINNARTVFRVVAKAYIESLEDENQKKEATKAMDRAESEFQDALDRIKLSRVHYTPSQDVLDRFDELLKEMTKKLKDAPKVEPKPEKSGDPKPIEPMKPMTPEKPEQQPDGEK